MLYRIVTILCGFLLLLGVGCCYPIPVAAQSIAPTQATTAPYAIPDWQTFTFEDFGKVDRAGMIDQVERSWQSGAPLTNILHLSDISDALLPELFSIGQIGDITQIEIGQLSLNAFPLLKEQSLSTLIDIVPNLGDFSVGEVLPIQALLSQSGWTGDANQTLRSVLDSSTSLSNLKLSSLDASAIDSFSLSQIPNLDSVPIEKFTDWENATIAGIPGLSQVPLAQMPNPLATTTGIVARVDAIYGPAERDRTNTITGSYQVGFHARCPADGKLVNRVDAPIQPPQCAYIELDDLEDEGRVVQMDFEGKQWISGKYHEVEGGEGALRFVPSAYGYTPGYEPTGRHPFSPLFKQVIWEPDETKDEATSYAFFRFCLPVLGCTPYNQVGVPFLTYPVNASIFVGVLDGTGGSGSIDMPGSGSRGAGAIETAGTGNSNSTGANTPCTGASAGGLNLDALSESIAAIESAGGGNHQAIGVYTCADGGTNCGRALGRYQTMSYLESVRSIVSQRPGGQAWLESIASGHQPSTAEMMQYYPPAAQEQVYRQEVEKLVDLAQGETDPKTGQPFTGGRLVERVAQMWYGGPASAIDSTQTDALGQLSGYGYGTRARQHYQAIAGKAQQCVTAGNQSSPGAAPTGTGQMTQPVPGSQISSRFGMRVHPITGEYKMHTGVDLPLRDGDPVHAADGGVVAGVLVDRTGYGNFVIVDHGNGRATLYAHLQAASVKPGDRITQGQVIATGDTSGGSTGPHLHFEVIDGYQSGNLYSGHPVNPEQYVSF